MRKVLRRFNPRNLLRARALRRNRAMPNERRRTERFLAVQRYIESDEASRTNILKRLKSLTRGQAGAGNTPVFLPSVLTANAHFAAGRYDDAVKSYRFIIRELDDALDAELRKPGKLKDGRRIDYVSVALAILNNNLAESLAEQGATETAIGRAFETAINLQPDLEFVRENYGYHLAKQYDWDGAEQSYLGAASCKPGLDSRLRLDCNMAGLALLKSEKRAKDEDDEGAIEALEAGLRRLPAGALQDHENEVSAWRARLHLELGDLQKRKGAFAKSKESYATAETDYAGAGDPDSAAFAALNVGFAAVRLGAYQEAYNAANRGLAAIDASREEGQVKWPQTKARLLSLSAVVLVIFDRPEEALTAFEASSRIWQTEGWTEYFEQTLADTSELWSDAAIADDLKQFFDEQIGIARAQGDVTRLERMTKGLSKLLPTELYAGDALEADPDLDFKPLSIEMDEAFLYPAGGPEMVIGDIIPALRDRLQAQFGIVLPPVRLRGYVQSAPNFNYVLLVSEVPKRVNLSKVGSRLVQIDADALRELKVGGTEVRGLAWLGDGPAHWVSDRAKDALDVQGIETWHALDVPFRELESLLRQELVEVFGHQATCDLLVTHDIGIADHTDLDTLFQPPHVTTLTQVLAALLAERVSLVDFEAIHRAFYLHWQEGAAPSDILMRLREDSALGLPLWGNTEEYAHFALGTRLVSVLEAAVQDPDATVLALAPELTQEVLSAVRTRIEGVQRPALVVPRRRLRALVHVIFKLEFPDLPVLSTTELRPGLSARIVDTIDVDEASV